MSATKHPDSTAAKALRFPPNNLNFANRTPQPAHPHRGSPSDACVVDQLDRAEKDLKDSVSASCRRIKASCMQERSEKERKLQKECDEGKKRERHLEKDLSERNRRVHELEDALSTVKVTIHMLEGMLPRRFDEASEETSAPAIGALASKRKRDHCEGEDLRPSPKLHKTSH